MIKILVSTLPFVIAFLLIAPTAKADSYDGPFCDENPTLFSSATPDLQEYDKDHIRGTCKRITYDVLVSLDETMQSYHFATRWLDRKHDETGPLVGTTTRIITANPEGGVIAYVVKGISQGNEEYSITPVPLEDIAAEEPFEASDRMIAAVDTDKSMFVNYKNIPTTFSSYVPVTSPVIKITEYWHVTKKPNGFMLIKDRTETYLDDGSTTTVSHQPTPDLQEEEKCLFAKGGCDKPDSWWFRFISFFKNLF
jgi:hypothetical protein